MFFGFLWRKIFNTSNGRILKSLQPILNQVNLLEKTISKMSDNELKSQTNKFRELLSNGKSLDDILPEAFATVREVSKRTINQRHYDVQIIGGIILHRGMISEMRTGEGKTLVATLPVYLNALTGKGVHVVTVNDYLAKRDQELLSPIYNFLGLTVGCLTDDIEFDERKAAYECDITYGTNHEFGFDYLRDNMKYSKDHFVQREFNYAIIDEVDSILIDEARTPLIISGPTEDNTDLYYRVDKLIPHLDQNDYDKDEKSKTVTLTDQGMNKIEDMMKKQGMISNDSGLYDIENISLIHHVNQALRAHKLFEKDVDYMIKDSKVMIIDEFTGRVMDGRRYSEGLHQALEAKENVEIQNENQTLASITYQNYFRLYPKISGMTGSAMTEVNEFREIYKLTVVEIPTHLPSKRIDHEDVIYRTDKEKYNAIIEEIEKRNAKGQPILVGTISIEKSELLSKLLKKKHIKHQVLNAKYHEQEAYIIAQAGRFGAVTIATNMAGRGTDIKLGGSPDMLVKQALKNVYDKSAIDNITNSIIESVEENKKSVLDAGGLFVLGTERHESRRIDNQLRGRSARQGDPGETKFFLSLEDDLMRIFASERISGLLKTLGLKENEAIFHPMITRSLEKAQQRVEAINYETRKNLLKFDDVMNDQRKVIYDQRISIIEADDVSDTLKEMSEIVNESLVSNYIPNKSYFDKWDIEGLTKDIYHVYGSYLPIKEWANDNLSEDDILKKIQDFKDAHFKAKETKFGIDIMKAACKRVLLITIDQLWKEHLHSLDNLRQGINLRAYGQKDPLNEYKKEAFMLFDAMLMELNKTYVLRMAQLEITNDHSKDLDKSYPMMKKMRETRVDPAVGIDEFDKNNWGKIGRNTLCPCGSGKKYKHCHGKFS